VLQIPEKSLGSTLRLKAQIKIFPSNNVTRIHTIGASRALWSMAENRYLQKDHLLTLNLVLSAAQLWHVSFNHMQSPATKFRMATL